MENIIYQIRDTDLATIEIVNTLAFYCEQTNNINPTYDIRQLGICLTNNKDLQIDFSLDLKEMKSLIKYLQDVLDYSEKFNAESLISLEKCK